MNRRDLLKHTALSMGYLAGGSVITALLNGCKPEAGIDWTPQFFTADQAATITALVDHILPKTETPGALEVGVDHFIDTMLAQHYAPEEQQKFLAGLADFTADCQEITGSPFHRCSPEEKDNLLQKYEAASAGIPPNVWGGKIGEFPEPPFYRKLKNMTLLGYFASEEVGEHLLNYDPIPGAFNGCIPLSEVENGYIWSL